MKENFCKSNTTVSDRTAGDNQGRSIVPKVVFGRREGFPGALFVLKRYRTASKQCGGQTFRLVLPDDCLFDIPFPKQNYAINLRAFDMVEKYNECWSCMGVVAFYWSEW